MTKVTWSITCRAYIPVFSITCNLIRPCTCLGGYRPFLWTMCTCWVIIPWGESVPGSWWRYMFTHVDLSQKTYFTSSDMNNWPVFFNWTLRLLRALWLPLDACVSIWKWLCFLLHRLVIIRCIWLTVHVVIPHPSSTVLKGRFSVQFVDIFNLVQLHRFILAGFRVLQKTKFYQTAQNKMHSD